MCKAQERHETNVPASSAQVFSGRDRAMDLRSLAGLVRVDVALASALHEAGWTVTKLGALDGVTADVVDAIVLGIEILNPDLKVNRTEFEELIEAADSAAQCIWAAHGGVTDSELSMVSRMDKMKRKLDELRKQKVEEINAKVHRKGSAPRDQWPTRLGRKLAEAGDNMQLRVAAEDQEREKWLKELRHLITVGAGGSSDEVEAITRRVGKGRRAGTLRKHVKVWVRFMDWLVASFQLHWPSSAAQVALYLETRASEPCGKSVPLSILKTLIFMEHAAEVPVQQQLNKQPAVKNAMEEVTLMLENAKVTEKRQARLLPLSVISAMEEAVMNVRLAKYVRSYAWYRLLKVWGAMRYHDTLGVDFSSIKLDESGLVCTLKRTKTTGPGKKVSLVKVFVGFDAWITEKDWLSEGWKVMKTLAGDNMSRQRDYLLQLPRKGLEGAQCRMASYSAASAMSQALFKVLQVPGAGDDQLLEEGAGVVWTEHSERVTLRTWAGAAGLPETVCKRLGRWTPSVDQAYDRSVRLQVIEAQEFMARFLKTNSNRRDPLDEEAVIEAVLAKLEQLGMDREKQEDQASRLRTFRRSGRAAIRGHWQGGDSTNKVGVPVEAGQFSPEFISKSENEEGPERSRDEPAPGQTRMGHYVVSVVGNTKSKTLHRVGDCFRQPGVHYRDFVCFGDEMPEPKMYHRSCKTCFPRNGGRRHAPGDEEESSGSETVSSSSESE